ncbi:META domain-containing protein [Pandoraea terrae]|uniref:META domain-containing protein n=1 Tax=Pandoraea terrae TaxID=1537710 RepID=A0A5E4XB71_9BURK|nr:META and DUF4377 domain-containing protein [Pandoraea terrae]VVE33455.1 META domain-containing protein [Pandoraea terrae]
MILRALLPATAKYAARLLLPVALLAACAQPQGGAAPAATGEPGAATAPSAAKPGDVTGTWQLIRWEGSGEVPALPEGRVVTLTLNDQGEFSGTGGCNRIFGQYSAGAGNTLSIKAPAATRMACPDAMAFEQRYLATLARVTGYERQDNLLVLKTANTERLTYANQTNLIPNVAGKVPTTGSRRTDRVLDVDSRQADCMGVAPRKCLRVRDAASAGGAGPWELWYDHIDGFDWKPGVEYRVRIHGEPVANPPADASRMRWTLVEVIRQTPAGKMPE